MPEINISHRWSRRWLIVQQAGCYRTILHPAAIRAAMPAWALVKTCRKLGLSFFAYLGAPLIPPLPDLIRARASS